MSKAKELLELMAPSEVPNMINAIVRYVAKQGGTAKAGSVQKIHGQKVYKISTEVLGKNFYLQLVDFEDYAELEAGYGPANNQMVHSTSKQLKSQKDAEEDIKKRMEKLET